MSSVEAFPAVPEPTGLSALLAMDQTVLEAIPAAVYVCAADGMLVRFNQRAAELWGRSPRPGDTDERFCGAFRLYHPDGRYLPHAETPMAKVLRGGEPVRDREVVIERPDGSRVVVAVNIQAVRGPTGRIQGAINCFQDISARKQSEELLRDTERRYRDILDAIPAAIYTTDAEGRITFFNPAAARMAGREPELGAEKWCVTWRLYRDDGTFLPHDQCPMAQALRERRPIRGESVVVERPDGSRVPVEPYPTPIFDRAGRLTGAINMLVDVSAQRQAVERLNTSEARYRGIFEGARVALWDQDFSPLLDRLDELRAQGVRDVRGYFEARPEELAKAAALVRVRDVNDYAVELFEAEGKADLLGALGATFLPETQPVFLDEIVALWRSPGTANAASAHWSASPIFPSRRRPSTGWKCSTISRGRCRAISTSSASCRP
jgi:PAS domain S-box-containing protein